MPIIPGIKVLTSKRQLVSIPRTFHCEIPEALAEGIQNAKPGHVSEVGAEWTLQQSRELLDAGAPSLHYYVMSSSKAINKVLAKLDL